jgi:hypothetical protein
MKSTYGLRQILIFSACALLQCRSVSAFYRPQRHYSARPYPLQGHSVSSHHVAFTSRCTMQQDPRSRHVAVPSSLAVVNKLRGGELSDLIEFAYEWCNDLGGPAALVAGAVIATIYETMRSGNLSVDPDDPQWVQFGKKFVRFLLLSAFALETMTIFCTTVIGTMLLSKPIEVMAETVKINKHTTPLMFLQENFEFEYLTARLTFLQGMINWLLAIALDHLIPSHEESQSTRLMNTFIASCLLTTLTLILAFYNGHMVRYRNYGHMCMVWARMTVGRFFMAWPPRPLSFVFVVMASNSLYRGYKAMTYNASKEKKKHH